MRTWGVGRGNRLTCRAAAIRAARPRVKQCTLRTAPSPEDGAEGHTTRDPLTCHAAHAILAVWVGYVDRHGRRRRSYHIRKRRPILWTRGRTNARSWGNKNLKSFVAFSNDKNLRAYVSTWGLRGRLWMHCPFNPGFSVSTNFRRRLPIEAFEYAWNASQVRLLTLSETLCVLRYLPVTAFELRWRYLIEAATSKLRSDSRLPPMLNRSFANSIVWEPPTLCRLTQ